MDSAQGVNPHRRPEEEDDEGGNEAPGGKGAKQQGNRLAKTPFSQAGHGQQEAGERGEEKGVGLAEEGQASEGPG